MTPQPPAGIAVAWQKRDKNQRGVWVYISQQQHEAISMDRLACWESRALIPATAYESLQAYCDQLTGEKFSDRNHGALQSRIESLQRRLDAAMGWMAEVENYLAERSDVIDGDYGQPAPNEEMKLLQELTEIRTSDSRAALSTDESEGERA